MAGQAAALADRREVVCLGHSLNIFEAGVTTDRLGATTHQFHAVEVDGIVAGGYLDATIHIEVKGGEINFFGACHAQVDHITASVHEAVGQSLLEACSG